MKLLLTSAGIKNDAIAQAILDLAGLSKEEIRMAYVPTAANIDSYDKGWSIDDMAQCRAQDYGFIDIVDFTALPKDRWMSRLESANVLFFGGGNEQYLAQKMREHGLRDELPKLLEKRLYVGVSAGSMVTGTFLSREMLKIVYPEEPMPDELEQGLGYVDFHFLPHLNSEYFTQMKETNVRMVQSQLTAPLYALDDQTALVVRDGQVDVIGGGKHILVEPTAERVDVS